jgi:hypothetical protein
VQIAATLFDVATNGKYMCLHQEIIPVKAVHEKILVTEPTNKSKPEEYLMIGKIQLHIPSSGRKPKAINPTFRTPPSYVPIGKGEVVRGMETNL